MNLGGYPMGAQYDPNAPYNQKEQKEQEITVTVSITLSKTIKLSTNQYHTENFGNDEDGNPNISYKFDSIDIRNKATLKITEELHIDKTWNVDEFEVIPEDYEVL